MKKRIFAIILAALMAVPFGILSASADTASVPAEPTATGTKTYYISNGKTGNGETAEDPANTIGWVAGQAFAEFVKEGGTVSIVGKCYATAVDETTGKATTAVKELVIPATTAPLLFTANGEIGTIDNEAKNGHGSQVGMIMAVPGSKVTFEGDVIFDNTVLLDRGNPTNICTFSVGANGKMVINSNVTIACTTWSKTDPGSNTGHNPILNVEEGGYAYLHTVGFSAYTGKGTLVIDEALKSEVESLLTNYEGKVVYVKAAADTTDSSATTTDSTNTSGTTTQAPTTDTPATGDMSVVAVVVAALSVATAAAVTMVTKKKEN